MAETEKTEAGCSYSEEEGMAEEEEEGFLPDYHTLQDYSKALLGEVVKATKAANSLPNEGDDFDYYSSFPGFRIFCNKMGSRVTRSIGRLIRHQTLPCYWPPSSQVPVPHALREEAGLVAMELDERMEAIIEANDILLERVGVLMDEVCGLRKRDEVLVPSQIHTGTAEVASWNRKTDSGAGGVASYNFMTSRNVPRPQVRFRDQVDNSNSPFVPQLRCKPNARQPLPDVYQRLQSPQSLNALIANSKEWALYKHKWTHPYQFEIENFVPTDTQIQLSEPQAPGSLEDVPFSFITREEELDQLIDELSHCTEFAIDLEHHSYRSFQGFVCLMQISTRNHDYIIDTLELRHHMHHLLDPFTNPRIVKVMHGADWDIPWLQRDFGLYVVNLFDTGQASRVLKLPKFSLAFLLQYCCGVEADKQYQLADWRIRPLPAVMEKYAREDTHYLLYIYDRMRNELIRRQTGGQNLLQTTLHLSQDVCLKTYQKPFFSGVAYLKLYYKHKRNFNSQQLHCLQLLHEWRDRVAREEDESPGYVLPNHMLFQISEQLPREAQGVLACCTPIPTLLRQQLQEVFMSVQEARQTPLTNELPKLILPAPTPPITSSSTPPTILPPSQPHTLPITSTHHTEPLSGSHKLCHIEPRGPPVKSAPPSLSAIEWLCPELSRTVEQQLSQIRASFPDVLAQFIDITRASSPDPPHHKPPTAPPTTASVSMPSSTETNDTSSETSTPIEGPKTGRGGKGLKSRRILSVREMKQRTVGTVVPSRARVGNGEEEEEEGELVDEDEGVVKKIKLEDGLTPFQYQGTSFTDYTHTPHQPVHVFQPRSSSGGKREKPAASRGLRSTVHMRSGERSHTYTGSRDYRKSHVQQRKT